MPSNNIGTLGKYEQKSLWNFLSFVQNIKLKYKKLSLTENKQLLTQHSFIKKTNIFDTSMCQNYWHPFIQYFVLPPFTKITALNLLLTDEFGEYMCKGSEAIPPCRIFSDPSHFEVHAGGLPFSVHPTIFLWDSSQGTGMARVRP